MNSVIDICNRALTRLGERAIASLEDDEERARVVARVYPMVRDAVLREHPWNFAVARLSLAALAEAPPWGFARQFQLPGDCLRLLRVESAKPWMVEGRRILSDAPAPLAITYLRRETDPSQYDALFVDALTARLAMELAEPLTQSNTKRDLARRDFTEAVTEARRADAQEQPPLDRPEDDWILARY